MGTWGGGPGDLVNRNRTVSLSDLKIEERFHDVSEASDRGDVLVSRERLGAHTLRTST